MSVFTRCPTVAVTPTPFHLTNVWKSGSLAIDDRSVLEACDRRLMGGQRLKVGLLPYGPKMVRAQKSRFDCIRVCVR